MPLPDQYSISIGQLDRIISIEKLTLAAQPNGQLVETWNAVESNVAAMVVQPFGAKVFAAQQNEVQFDYQVTMRWRAGINATDTRLIYLGRILEIIRQPAEIGRRHWLECLCCVRPVA